ncbi:MAG TPA: hypothetical protein VE685_15525 [Thermoanaerobaculia bacterium]|nr:hypothetical protein [Thermoanaerobaculia bacterium]
MGELTLHTVVLKEGDWWLIQGLEYDFVTLARRLDDVPGEIRRWLYLLAIASRQSGIELFAGYSPAPRRFWQMYEDASPWGDPVPPVNLPEDLDFNPMIEIRLLEQQGEEVPC